MKSFTSPSCVAGYPEKATLPKPLPLLTVTAPDLNRFIKVVLIVICMALQLMAMALNSQSPAHNLPSPVQQSILEVNGCLANIAISTWLMIALL